MNTLIRQFKNILLNNPAIHAQQLVLPITSSIHTTGTTKSKWNKFNHGPKKWLEYNKEMFPPQLDALEEPRKAVTNPTNSIINHI